MSYRSEFNETSKEVKWTFWKVLPMVIGFIVVMGVIGYVLGWFSEGAEVAQKEFGAKAALQKYEWFKDQSQRIEKMKADIATYEQRDKGVEKQYAEYGDKKGWSPDIRVQYNHSREIARDDLTAVVSQYNNLVKEYNSQSSKFNWVLFKTRSDKPKETMEEYIVPADL